jgi:hypothetical protein
MHAAIICYQSLRPTLGGLRCLLLLEQPALALHSPARCL